MQSEKKYPGYKVQEPYAPEALLLQIISGKGGDELLAQLQEGDRLETGGEHSVSALLKKPLVKASLLGNGRSSK